MENRSLKNLTITEVVSELQKDNLRKNDMIVPSRLLSMVEGKIIVKSNEDNDALNKLLVETGITMEDSAYNIIELGVLDTCHSHLSSRLNIPKKYYDLMNGEEDLSLIDHNVTHWLHNANKNYLLRSFIDKEEKNGVVRGLLSDRYNVMDNYDVMLATLQAVKETGINVQIESGDITDKKFFLRFTCPDIEVEAPELLKNYKVPNGSPSNNGIITGFVISNSETGFGTFSISPRAVVLACSNGMIFKDDAYAKRHLGSKLDEYSTIDWSEGTRTKNFELVCSQVKDAIKTYASQDYLKGKIQDLSDKGNKELNHPIDCVKNVTKHLIIGEEKEKSILDYFFKSGDSTGFGVTQAITYYAQHNASPEERFELESKGVEVLSNIDSFDVAVVKERASKIGSSHTSLN
tara:strand:+ start:5256 stop:6470 length:1215 start_codon:yes stop_codon:yes gene_type:complete